MVKKDDQSIVRGDDQKNKENIGTPIWYDKSISRKVNLPNKNFKKIKSTINFGDKNHNKKFCSQYVFQKNTDNFSFNPIEIESNKATQTSLKKYKTILNKEKIINQEFKSKIDKLDKKIKKTKKDKLNKKTKKNKLNKVNNKKSKLEIKINKSNYKINGYNTKIKKIKDKLDKCTVSKKITLYPDNNQKKILHEWFRESIRVYNKCVELNAKDNKYFNKGYMKRKIDVFKSIYGNNTKLAPYDILTDEVRIFCSNLKSAFTNLKKGNINHFQIGKKKYNRKNYCIFIPRTAVNKNGIYISHLGKMEGFKLEDNIVNDCRLNYIKDKNRYELIISLNIKRKKIKNRENIVALDPGEKIFMAYFGEKSFGKIGKDIRTKILIWEQKIRKLQRILSRNKNKDDKKLRNRKHIKKKIREKYDKIKNIVKELHNKTAYYLCNNYDRILLPKFETQNMLTDKIKKKTITGKVKENIKKIKEENEGEEVKTKIRKYLKKNRLNGRVKFTLNMLSHYKFKQHLINKCNEYGCKYYEVTEEYTSKTCTMCGKISDKYKKRKKECESCKFKIDRDINGSRNILIKNLKLGYTTKGVDTRHKIAIDL